jgi:hypothetical protein
VSSTVFQLPEHAAHVQREWAGEATRIRLARIAAGVRRCCEATASLAQRFAAAIRPVRSAGQPCTGTC